MTPVQAVLRACVVTAVAAKCASNLDCSLNGICKAGSCDCDAPWNGPECGNLAFAAKSPAAGRALYDPNDMLHNTWNGPIVVDAGQYHMYVPLYPAGLLYHPVSLMHGTASSRLGPWTWSNLTGVDVSFNPGALTYKDSAGTTHYTLWTTKVDGAALGKVYTATSAAGPFSEIPGSNTSGCYINPSPLYVDGVFYCTGQKGSTLMTAKEIGGPWTEYANITHSGEDPFFWVDAREHWHALYHTSGNSAPNGVHCGNSSVSSHHFSADKGKTWNDLHIQPYKPTVKWDDDGKAQTYATMERPHLYFDETGKATHLGVASTLNIGDEGCPYNASLSNPGCRHGHPGELCSCQSCKYVSHAGTLLITLADGVGPVPTHTPPSPPTPPPAPTPAPAAHPCQDYGTTTPTGYKCHAGYCSGTGGHCGTPLSQAFLNPKNLSSGCSFTTPSEMSLATCAAAAAAACDAQKGCDSFAIDPGIHLSAPTAMLFAADEHALTPNTAWNVWARS